ncbi:hypothetical protein [Microbacterium lacusdiani]
MRPAKPTTERRGSILLRQLEPLALVVSVAIGAAFILYREQFVPAHFRFDSDKIQEGAQGRVYDDSTFDTVSAIYRFLGLADAPDIAGLLGYALFVVTLLVAVNRSKGSPSLYRVAVLSIAAVLGGVYLGGYSKDAFVLLIVLALLIAGPHLLWDIAILAIMVWYGLNFRQYWLLVALGYVAFRLLQRRPMRVRWLLFWLIVGIAIVSLGFWLVFDIAPDMYRTRANETRSEIASATVIEPFIEGAQPFAGIANNILTVGALFVPLPLALKGEVYYVAIAAMLVTVWVGFLRSASRFGRTVDSVSPHNILTIRAVSLVLAFVMVQSLFEPDYGSALRHLVPLLPLMIAVGTVRFAPVGEPAESKDVEFAGGKS